jgi:uncharacterized protein YbcI
MDMKIGNSEDVTVRVTATPGGARVAAPASVGGARCTESEFPHGKSKPIDTVMRTTGEIEAAVCGGMSRFEQEYMGRGPKDVRAYLMGDLLVVRLQGILTAAEQQLVKKLPDAKGRDLLKQVRTHLLETARPRLEEMIAEITGTKILSLHHDVSTTTGERVVVFTLMSTPVFRESKRK